MTHIRIGESTFLLPDDHWEEWVRSGRIPADAWIRSPVWTKGVWRLADSLEVYHLFLPTVAREARPRAPGLTDTVFARSGLGIKHGICLSNGVGVIDSDYRGEIKVGLSNLSDSSYTIAPGDRIAQLSVLPIVRAEIELVDQLGETGRGAGGFGSTGK